MVFAFFLVWGKLFTSEAFFVVMIVRGEEEALRFYHREIVDDEKV